MMYDDLFVSESIPQHLSKNELYYYFKEYRQGNIEARNMIIKHNIRLVISQVNKRFFDTIYDKNELVSIGIIGLIKSVDTFDISKNFEFSTYAVRCIDNEILMFMRTEKKHTLVDALERNLEIDGTFLQLKDTIEDEQNDLYLNYRNKELRMQIINIINSLNECEAQIIMLYFGFYNDRRYTQEEISKIFSYSRPHVSKIIKRCLDKIKEKILEENLIDINERIKTNKKTTKK